MLAIQQLLAETRDPRFQRLTVLFRPWRSETHILTAHLIENELRGEMTFWDKACGIVALKSRLEAEKARALSLRQLEDELKSLGLSVNTATLAHCIFATDRLRTLGEAISDLSGLDVKNIQPRLNLMKRHAQARASLAEAEVYATVFESVFLRTADKYRQTSVFSAAALCRACEEALALKLGQPSDQMRSELEARSRTSPGSLDAATVPFGASQATQSNGTTSRAVAAPESRLATVSSANESLAPPGCLVLVREGLSMNADRAPKPSRLIEQVRRFAELAGIDDCLRFHDSTPLGFAMDALPTPADVQSLPAHRPRSWRLLALLSGQFDDGASHSLSECLAQADPEQRAVEAAATPATTRPLDAELLGWLLDAQDQVASAFWDVLSLAREARAAVAVPRELDTPAPAPGDT